MMKWTYVWGTIVLLLLSIGMPSTGVMLEDPKKEPPAKEESLSQAYEQLQDAVKEFLDKNYQAAQKSLEQAKVFLQKEGKQLTAKTQEYLQELQKRVAELEEEIKKGKEGAVEALQETWRKLEELLKQAPFWREQSEKKLSGIEAYPAFHIWVELAQKLHPAVVHISAARLTTDEPAPTPYREEDPFNEFFQRFFGQQSPARSPDQLSLGSGFLINEQGHILTNEQVIENTQQLLVKLADNQQYAAEVIGRDARTGIALLKITPPAGTLFPFIPFGDSDALHIAEPVMALGNPFGGEPMVTIGFVSSRRQRGEAAPSGGFLQITSPFHAGMSGGPLVNIQGEVVGINMMNAEGEERTGFAIPINLVKSVLPSLHREKLQHRLGLSVQPLTPALAQAFRLKEPVGALVSEVVTGSPAERAGLRRGDVIITFAGKPVSMVEDVTQLITEALMENEIPVTVIRQGQEITLEVKVEEFPEEKGPAESRLDLGMTVQTLSLERAQQLGIPDTEGVLITKVEQGSPAEEADLQPEDVIREVNHVRIHHLQDYYQALKQRKEGEPLLMLVRRGDQSFYTTLLRGQ